MTGLTPVPRVAFQSCTAPAIEPWSVRPTDGISSSAARATRSGTRHAPSRIEYSEWTCRWTKSAMGEVILRPPQDGPGIWLVGGPAGPCKDVLRVALCLLFEYNGRFDVTNVSAKETLSGIERDLGIVD